MYSSSVSGLLCAYFSSLRIIVGKLSGSKASSVHIAAVDLYSVFWQFSDA